MCLYLCVWEGGVCVHLCVAGDVSLYGGRVCVCICVCGARCMCSSVCSWGCVPMVDGRVLSVCVSVSVCWGRRGLCLYLCVYVCVRQMCTVKSNHCKYTVTSTGNKVSSRSYC